VGTRLWVNQPYLKLKLVRVWSGAVSTWQVWWANVKRLLTRKCGTGDFEDSVNKVCCHEDGA
jgi:hypothetical protein